MNIQTQQKPAEAKKPILIKYDEIAAQNIIDAARSVTDSFQAIIDAYHGFDFPTKITSIDTLQRLLGDYSNFIFNERLKGIPETMNGVKIDRVKFLRDYAAVPAGLNSFLDQLAGAPKLTPELYVLKDGQIEFNEEMVPVIERREQVWTNEAQTEAYYALQELADIYLRLSKLGYEVRRLYNMFAYRPEFETGKPAHFAFDPQYSLRAKYPTQ